MAQQEAQPDPSAVCHSGVLTERPEREMPAKRAYGMDQDFYP